MKFHSLQFFILINVVFLCLTLYFTTERQGHSAGDSDEDMMQDQSLQENVQDAVQQPEPVVNFNLAMEIEADEDEGRPNPIEVWQELVDNDESIGVNADLLAKAGNCIVHGDGGDESRRERSKPIRILFVLFL